MTMPSIFHITIATEWKSARRAGADAPASLERESFIHFSSAEQVVRVANARFRGTPDLVLLRVAPERLRASLRYEIPDDSPEPFPHLYGPLNVDAVDDVMPFPEGAEGFTLPAAAVSDCP